jgi:hypothetical protein
LSSERLNNEEIEMGDEPPTEETAEMLLPPTDEFQISLGNGDLISDRDLPPPHPDHDCDDPFIPRRLLKRKRLRDEH